MATPKTGDFCWVELCSPDIAKSLDFYKPLFQWQENAHDMGDQGTYYMLSVGDKDFGGAFQLTDELKKQGAMPCWASYVAVDDVDATTEKAKSLGGNLLNGPFDIGEYGRMAVLQDPTGAVFCLWKSFEGMDGHDKKLPGNFGWNELITEDTGKAQAFYTELFGWQAETQDFGDVPYTSFSCNGKPVGGMLKTPDDCGDLPSMWVVYFTVTDLDKTLAAAKAKGAEQCHDVMDIAEVGRFAAIKDPQGVYCSFIQFAS